MVQLTPAKKYLMSLLLGLPFRSHLPLNIFMEMGNGGFATNQSLTFSIQGRVLHKKFSKSTTYSAFFLTGAAPGISLQT